MKVSVLGLGYVGCVSAACLAKLGHDVTGVDKDAFKLEAIAQGKAPFHEPGLEELVSAAISSGGLRVCSSLAEGIAEADVVLICVGTPSDSEGNLDMTFLRRVSQEIAEEMKLRQKPLVVSIRSTVFPGINQQIHHEIFGFSERVKMVSNPEFLREGSAVKDFFEPSLIVVGGEDAAGVDLVASLYAALPCTVQRVTLRTAEMVKYACNAFHAVKIAFANEIGSLCQPMGIDAQEVMHVLCQDKKLNISAAYLRPGFAFGGSCLPKDLRAITYRAKSANLRVPLLESVLPSNDQHLHRLAARVQELSAVRIGIFGLAFKENTDDLRESPVLRMIEQLIASGRAMKIFDPNIDLSKIYGANQRYLLDHVPHIARLMTALPEEMLAWADHVVLTQKPTPDMKDRIAASGKPVLDLTQ